MGIKASRHEWLVFTEPDCRPQSNQWLKQMARNFTPATEIVLGYSNYEKVPGWFNKKITFDTLLNSMRYLGMAVSGHPTWAQDGIWLIGKHCTTSRRDLPPT